MSNTIQYYFTSISPFAYLGHKKLMEIAKANEKTIEFRPFDIFGVWEVSGAAPPAERPAVRQRYRKIEIQRAAIMRDTCMNPSPEFFPTDPTQADLCICALTDLKLDANKFSQEIGRAVWERNLHVADKDTLISLLNDCGHDGAHIYEHSQSDEVVAIRAKNTKEAIEADAIGAPAYVYDGEVFWGQDRLEYLEQMIASGRRAFTSDV